MAQSWALGEALGSTCMPPVARHVSSSGLAEVSFQALGELYCAPGQGAQSMPAESVGEGAPWTYFCTSRDRRRENAFCVPHIIGIS